LRIKRIIQFTFCPLIYDFPGDVVQRWFLCSLKFNLTVFLYQIPVPMQATAMLPAKPSQQLN